MIDLNKLKFPTRVQKTNELLVRRVQRMKFMKALTEFWDSSGAPLSKLPQVLGQEIDLHLVYTQVGRRGGFEQTTADRKWTEVAESMNMHGAALGTLASALKKHYEKLLLPYERVAKGLDAPPQPRPRAPPPARASSVAAPSAPNATDEDE